jgi:hypothetical protein
MVHVSETCQYYPALIALASKSMRWRKLTIRSFPNEKRLLELEALGTFLTFNGPLVSLESFRTARPCKMNTALGNLIDHTRKAENQPDYSGAFVSFCSISF